MVEESPVLKHFRPPLLIDITTEGLRIQIVDNQNRPTFATGQADVQPYIRDILRELGAVLNELPNKISISGHTDASQYARGEKAYGNRELSADHANVSRQKLVAGGMKEGKVLRIQGLASSMRMVKDDPYAAANRRISLVVLNESTQRRIERENAAAASLLSATDATNDAGVALDPAGADQNENTVQALVSNSSNPATTTDTGTVKEAPPVGQSKGAQ